MTHISLAADRYNVVLVSIVVVVFVDYVCNDHQDDKQFYWASVSMEQF